MAALIDAQRYEILYDLKDGEYNPSEVGGIRTKTIRAGQALEVECFPLIRANLEADRERRRRASTKYQENLNLKNARKKVRRLLETNFTENDISLTLTFDYGFIDRGQANMGDVLKSFEEMDVPIDDQEARKYIKNYLARVRRMIKRRGGDPKTMKYLYVIESTAEPRDEDINALPMRYHYHMVISAPELNRDDLEGCWPYGYANADRLQMRDGLEALANYITKQRRFFRRFAHSKNLKQPDIRVSDRKISRRRAAMVAMDVQAYGREIFEKLYPGYVCVNDPQVRFSDFVAGAYIYARMLKRREMTGRLRS